jgi:hypothetical protein
MENEAKPKKKMTHPGRVTLTPESLARLSQWIEETQGHFKGSRISRSDLANFLIMSHTARLSEKEVEQLESQYFDEVRFAAWAFAEVKKARVEGKVVTLAEIVASTSGNNKKGDQDGNGSV